MNAISINNTGNQSHSIVNQDDRIKPTDGQRGRLDAAVLAGLVALIMTVGIVGSIVHH